MSIQRMSGHTYGPCLENKKRTRQLSSLSKTTRSVELGASRYSSKIHRSLREEQLTTFSSLSLSLSALPPSRAICRDPRRSRRLKIKSESAIRRGLISLHCIQLCDDELLCIFFSRKYYFLHSHRDARQENSRALCCSSIYFSQIYLLRYKIVRLQ